MGFAQILLRYSDPLDVPTHLIGDQGRAEYKKLLSKYRGLVQLMSALNIEVISQVEYPAMLRDGDIVCAADAFVSNYADMLAARTADQLFTFLVLGIIVFVAATFLLSNSWFSMNWGDELSSLFLSIWYPIFIAPYVLALAYYASLESMSMRINVVGENLPAKEFANIAMALLPNFRYIRHFNGWNAHEYLQCLNPPEKASYLDTFKREIDTVAANANVKVKRFESGKGRSGFDEDGIWLDWTYLEEMKSFLWTIASLENRSWMESGVYSSLDEAFDCFVPKDCKGSLLLSRGKAVYVCWAIDPSGFVFAAGSRDGAFPFMKYEGDRCPITDGTDMLSEFVDDSGDADTRLKNWHFSFYIDKSYL